MFVALRMGRSWTRIRIERQQVEIPGATPESRLSRRPTPTCVPAVPLVARKLKLGTLPQRYNNGSLRCKRASRPESVHRAHCRSISLSVSVPHLIISGTSAIGALCRQRQLAQCTQVQQQ